MQRLLLCFLCAFVLMALPTQAQIRVELPEMEIARGAASVKLPITTADLTGKNVKSYDITITYDPAVLKLTGIDKQNTLSKSMSVVVNPNSPGVLRIAAATADALSGDGVLLYLIGEYVSTGETPLRWERMEYNEGHPTAQPQDGRVAVGQALPGEEEPLAEAFALDTNFPNPFAARTTIRFSVRETAPVQLQVFDVLGRPVRTLVSGMQQAGVQTVTFEAHDLPSGQYFYRLTTPAGTLTRKMVLVR